jgi:tetratricopeptide (TPR) repeat protein/DNA-binding CsgD family transcriptional regulator
LNRNERSQPNHERIFDDLEAQLDRTTDRAERYDLLMSAAERIYRSSPSQGLELIDRARRLLKALRDPTRSVRCYRAAGNCEYVLGRYPEARKQFERALKLSREIDYPEGEVWALQGIGGLVQVTAGEYLPALETLREALRIAESIGGTPTIVDIHNSTAIIFRHLGDHTRAIGECHKAITLAASIGKNWAAPTITLGVEYLTLKDFHHARISFERGISLAVESGDRRAEGIATVNLGNTLHHLREYDNGQRYYESALAIVREIGDPMLEAYVLRSIGTLRRDMGLFADALEVLRTSYEISVRIGDASGYVSLMSIGETHADMGNLAEAEDYMLRTLDEARRQGDRDSELPVHACIADLYEKKGDLALALHHHKLHATLKEELIGREHQREMHQMRMRADVERAEKDREAAELRSRELEAEMEQKTKELTAMALQMVEKNTFLEELKQGMSEVAVELDASTRPKLRTLVGKVERSINAKKEWSAFEEQFEKVHHGFLRRLAERHSGLTPTELKICALVKLDLPTKEIADILRSSARTVEWHRSNVRRKLGFPPDANLTTHFASR